MPYKNLTESDWKSFAKNRGLKDAALLKAFADLAKAERAVESEGWLAALKKLEDQIEALRKEHRSDKEILEQLKKMDAALATARRDAESLAKQEARESESEEDEGPAALTSKLIPLLRNVRKGVACQALVAVGSKEAAVMLSRRALTPAARKPMAEYLDASGTPKFIAGECIYEANAVTFVLKSEAAGLAKKIKAALLKQTEMRVKVRVRGESPDDIDDDGDPPDADDDGAQPAVPVTPTSTQTPAPTTVQTPEQIAAAKLKAEQQTLFKTRLVPLVPRVKVLASGGFAGARVITTSISEAAALVASDPPAALARLDKIAEVVVAAERAVSASSSTATATPSAKPADSPEEQQRKREAAAMLDAEREDSNQVSEQNKRKLGQLLEADTPDINELRKVIKAELERANAMAKKIAQATADGLPITPSPAKVSFAVNADPGSSQWNEAACKAAFKKYGWFTFKAMRKSQEPVDLPGITAPQNTINDEVMWKLYQYRRHYVDSLIAKLHAAHKDAGLLFKSGGSEDIESDLDITVASPGSGVDVVAMKAFNDQVKADFGRPPGRVFDTNLYARDYNAIKDNLSAPGAAGKTPDHAIAEPVGGVASMAGIDQDVATLMKQRRFLDEASFNKMWHALRDSMPEGKDRDRIQQRFEEAEDAYLLTARDKVLEIAKAVQAKLDALPEKDRRKFEAANAEFLRINAAADAASREALPAALAAVQAQLPKFLDMLEETFPDEVMETTDAIYAKTMTELRANQAKVNELESHLLEAADGADCEKLHKGVAHADWLAQGPTAINALKARIKQAQFTNIVFANEAYVSQGAITHIVSGAQAADPATKAEVLAKITPAELLQSANEQMADFYKDMKHLEHGAHEAEGDKNKRRANGEAFVHASKYLSRMLDAAAMLQDKYKADEAAMAILTAKPYDLCARAKAASPAELQKKIDDQLVSLRKSSTLPGDAKAEVAVADVMALFQVRDIGGLRGLITAFGVDFNQRVRSLADFSKAQDVSRDTEREYFRPAV